MLPFSKYVIDTKTLELSRPYCHAYLFYINKKGLVKSIRCSISEHYEIEWGLRYKNTGTITGFYMVEYMDGIKYIVEPQLINGLPSISETFYSATKNREDDVKSVGYLTTVDFYYLVLLAHKIEEYLDKNAYDYTLEGEDTFRYTSVLYFTILNTRNTTLVHLEVRALTKKQVSSGKRGFNVRVNGKQSSVMKSKEILSMLPSLNK